MVTTDDLKVAYESFKLGLEAFDRKEYETAVELFDKVLAVFPSDSSSVYYKAQAYYNLERYGDAVLMFRRVLKINPSNMLAKIGIEKAEQYIEEGLLQAQFGDEPPNQDDMIIFQDHDTAVEDDVFDGEEDDTPQMEDDDTPTMEDSDNEGPGGDISDPADSNVSVAMVSGKGLIETGRAPSKKAAPLKLCPYCGESLDFPQTPRFCPFCEKRIIK